MGAFWGRQGRNVKKFENFKVGDFAEKYKLLS